MRLAVASSSASLVSKSLGGGNFASSSPVTSILLKSGYDVGAARNN